MGRFIVSRLRCRPCLITLDDMHLNTCMNDVCLYVVQIYIYTLLYMYMHTGVRKCVYVCTRLAMDILMRLGVPVRVCPFVSGYVAPPANV